MNQRISMWSSEWTNERRLQDRLDATAHAAHSASSDLNALRTEVRQLQRQVADLERKAADTAARAQLNQWDPARRLRDAAELVVAAALARESLPTDLDLHGLADERGYWLGPVVRSLPDLLAGRPDPAQLQAASGRDRGRTATFLASFALLCDQPVQALPWLPTAMEPGPNGMTAAQRVLWLAADLDRTVAGPVQPVVQQLIDAASPADRDDVIEKLVRRTPLTTDDSGATPVGRLTAWVELGDALDGPMAGNEQDRTEIRAQLAALLNSLIAEGSGPETGLLDQIEPDRGRLIQLDGPDTVSWGDPAGSALALAAGDLDVTRPAHARRALDLIRPEVMAAVTRLADEGTVPFDGRAVLRIYSSEVVVTETGPQDAGWLKAIEATWPRPQPITTDTGFWVGSTAAAVALVLAVIDGPFWWIVFGIAVVVVGVAVGRNRAEMTRATKELDERRAKAKDAVRTATQALTDQGQVARRNAELTAGLLSRARTSLGGPIVHPAAG